MVKDLASAYEAANTLLEMAQEQAKAEFEIRNEEEITKFKESYGITGGRLATGGNKLVKELEKKQKIQNLRAQKDFLEMHLKELLYSYEKSLKPNFKKYEIQNDSSNSNKISEIVEIVNTLYRIQGSISLNLTVEALFSKLLLKKKS
jgi:hypothetical protein